MAQPRSPASPDKDYWGWLKRTNPTLYAKLITTRRHGPRDYRDKRYNKRHPERRMDP